MEGVLGTIDHIQLAHGLLMTNTIPNHVVLPHTMCRAMHSFIINGPIRKKPEPKGIELKMMTTSVRVHHDHCILAKTERESVLPLRVTDVAGS